MNSKKEKERESTDLSQVETAKSAGERERKKRGQRNRDKIERDIQ